MSPEEEQRIVNKIANMVCRMLITKTDDSQDVQFCDATGLDGEEVKGLANVKHFGFASHPPPGTQAIGLFTGGDRGHGVLVGTENGDYRIQLEEGEAAIYNQAGDKITLKKTGEIEIKASTKVSIVSPLVEMSGNLSVAGNIGAIGALSALAGSFNIAGGVANISVPTNIIGAASVTGSITATGNIGVAGTSTAADHLSTSKSGLSHTHIAGVITTGPPL